MTKALAVLGWVSRFTWELPQTFVGFLVWLIQGWQPLQVYRGSIVTDTANFGVSLGGFIFSMGKSAFQKLGYPKQLAESDAELCIRHEGGHAVQSRILGPLYLLIVGIPSLVMNLMSSWSLTYGKRIFWKNYYKRFPENWADRLGGIKDRPAPF